MMNAEERATALIKMKEASDSFYLSARATGNHPFIEFTGLINEYIKACEAAHAAGIDFTECNRHSGQALPLESYMATYINEKLECIFSGAIVMTRSNDGKMQCEIPRRAHLDKMTAAERAIYDAMQAVEAVGADVRLTDAVVLLGHARDSVADYVDNIRPCRRVVDIRDWTD